ncbi:MAG: phosphatidylserine decarboxylase family protein [Planctomycetes bacterium]|nr:phosphatidylserine decarboxylase family protein [Planctomycetota bacterium]
MLIPITPHGTRELIAISVLCGLLAWGLALVAWPLVLLPAALWLFAVSFFRDPERKPPADPQLMVSPADGVVADIVELPRTDLLAEPCVRVGVFLSVLNVHVNRCPWSAKVAALKHQPGEFLDARHPEVSTRNEAQEIRFEATFPFVVRQVAGLIARRIVCPLAVGQSLGRGERMGMIKFGSRTELIVPLRLRPEVLVKVGDTVSGTSTPLIRLPASATSA